MQDLMEITCLWQQIYTPMKALLGDGPDLEKITTMWNSGSLDAELRAHSKAMEPGWDWRKLSFILEAQGKVQEREVCNAQSKVNSALQNSLQAGFSLFETNLESDHLKQRRPDAEVDTSGLVEARLQPWISETLAGLNGGIRSEVKAEAPEESDEEQPADAEGKKWAVATVCHSSAEANFVSLTIATKLFAMARNKELRIEGFPDFGGALTELKQFQRAPKPEFQVCVGLEGALVIKQALVEFWSRKEHFADRMNSLVNQHNEEFNPKNLKRGAEENPEDPESSAAQPPAKRLCLGTAKTVSELETEYTDRLTLNCGHFSLALCLSDSSVWMCASAAHTAEQGSELWGYGSGDFAKGTEAADIMTDVSAEGRWLKFSLPDANTPVILEKQRKVPEHLAEETFWNKVLGLGDLLKALEDSGEVNIEVAEHRLKKDESCSFTIEPAEEVCFVLDAVKQRKRKKPKAANALSFGAKMDFSKTRGSKNIQIIWRLRLSCHVLTLSQRRRNSAPAVKARLHTEAGDSVVSQLVPVRPCAALAGSISLKPDQALQLM
ncbi:unnamed protein product [Effrenium voratum]|uniref:Uncharacterized protein n=1 Tax=Effrenium voratum TaxID=2562239 RepID=A0AA36MVR8_9DINO|nr:unnamed protein product [Effrenium voratum]